MHPDREPAGAGVDVVARQRTLPHDVEPAIGVEREEMRRDNRPAPQQREDVGGNLGPMADPGHAPQPSSGPAIATASRASPNGSSRP